MRKVTRLSRVFCCLSGIVLGAVLSAPMHADAADAARGAIVAQVRCTACHHLHSQWTSIGPGLKNLYGRAPSIAGVPFSVWDEAALNAWLSNPRKIKANTRMRIPPIAARDRADLIAYFKSVRGEE